MQLWRKKWDTKGDKGKAIMDALLVKNSYYVLGKAMLNSKEIKLLVFTIVTFG